MCVPASLGLPVSVPIDTSWHTPRAYEYFTFLVAPTRTTTVTTTVLLRMYVVDGSHRP